MDWVDWARKRGLDEEGRWGGERRKASEEGEGAACFEVSPRWPEEVKSHVNLRVNVQKKYHLLTEQSSYIPHSWSYTIWPYVKVVKTVQSVQQLVGVNLWLSDAKCHTRMNSFGLFCCLSSWVVYMSCLVFSIYTNPDTWHLVYGSRMSHFWCVFSALCITVSLFRSITPVCKIFTYKQPVRLGPRNIPTEFLW